APRRRLEIEAELGILVAAGQLDEARGRQHGRGGLWEQLADGRAEGVVADLARIVVHLQRAEGGHRLDDARQRLLLDEVLEGAHPAVDLDADLLAELDGNREIARREEPQR